MDDDALDEVLDLVEEHKWAAVRRRVSSWDAEDISDILEDLDDVEAALLLRALPRALMADVFADVDHDRQEDLLQAFSDQETRQLLLELDPDDRTAVLEELPSNVTRRLFALLPASEVKEARALLGYPEDSVGRLMTPDFVELRADMTLAKALEHIRAKGHDSETMARLYVTEKGKLTGDVRLRQIILGQPDELVSAFLDRDCARLSAFDDREEAVRVMARADTYVVPVVDSQGSLVGIVTHDDVLDVAEEEATEDIQIGAAVAPLDMSYRAAGVGLLYSRRIWWLSALVFVSLLSSGIIAAFEGLLAEAIALVFFLPVLAASGGNTGSQCATLMVRALATGDVRPSEWFRMLGKELLVGLFLGITLGAFAWGLGIFRADQDIALVVALTMVTVVLVSNLIGMSMPFILRRAGVDPAVASAPLIASIMDAVTLIIYLSVAAWLL